MQRLPASAPVLVVGLGNRAVTPDSLGPRVIDSIFVTRHIKQYMPDAVPETVREVSALAPGVLGVTGVETMEIIRGVAEHTKPAVISTPARRFTAAELVADPDAPQTGADLGEVRARLSPDTHADAEGSGAGYDRAEDAESGGQAMLGTP